MDAIGGEERGFCAHKRARGYLLCREEPLVDAKKESERERGEGFREVSSVLVLAAMADGSRLRAINGSGSSLYSST